jgi:outer membrane receptor for ferric coprogen and ferric-rhodotorulic acid
VVNDRQGGAVVGADVTLTSEAGAMRTAMTQANGTFTFDGVRPGQYTLQVNFSGFAAWSQVVRAGATGSELTVTLDIAGLSETVGVVGTGVSTLSVPAPTATRLGLTPLETPASLTIVTGDTIRQRGDVTVEEAETRMVGITSQSAPGDGGGSRMSGTLTFPFDTWSVERIDAPHVPRAG